MVPVGRIQGLRLFSDPDGPWWALRLRWRRARLLVRALRKRGELQPVADRTAAIRPGAILAFACLRNEAERLPHFLDHHRRLGVSQFLIVDNASTDDTPRLLADAPDVSVWRSEASYRAARFGMDWLTWLLTRHGAGHWCLTLDADELLVFPRHDSLGLPALTAWLDARRIPMLAALMLELYPEGPLSSARCAPGADPLEALPLFDAEGYLWDRQRRYAGISIRGGVRRRAFFADAPDRAPHLHKTPLIRWRRGHVYVSSTHIALPRRLNAGFDARRDAPTGALLHSKFLDLALAKSAEDKVRCQHFTHPGRYGVYYDAILADPVLADARSVRFRDWRQLQALGLIAGGAWAPMGAF
ncbi:glycosyltransferase family 2 protein [Rhodovulum kholense]|uniref:Glycosyl transferase family 2 n=1 Tax=Rhodovulum kholense TaxID=453584 RepID=A0A8E3ANZ9_9RHOB|nr:glycosyltransferase family 2 protein [Rhodovulum kholense]PTW43806.1 glycosyl transferase family 2 [Rhodovulum kholense]